MTPTDLGKCVNLYGKAYRATDEWTSDDKSEGHVYMLPPFCCAGHITSVNYDNVIGADRMV